MTRFSFLLPTRNRAPLLRQALAAVLAQPGGDLEVVVSDNASSDETPEVIREFGDDPRLRVVRTPRPLNVVDNWEHALDHATGEWIVVVGDDDGPVPSLVSRLDPLADPDATRAVAWAKAWYVHPGVEPAWPVPGQENHLVVFPYGGRAEEVAAGPELEAFFRRRERATRPEMNAAVHRQVIERIRREAGRVFRGPDPAVGLCAAFLALEPSYLALDLPLVVMGLSAASISTSLAHDLTSVHTVVREYHAAHGLRHVPLTSRTVANLVAESLLNAKEALPAHFEGVDLDRAAYFLSCGLELKGRDDAGARREWRAALRAEPPAVRAAVRRSMAADAARAWTRRTIQAVTPLAAARRLVRRGLEGRTDFLVLSGADHGFAHLPGAAHHLDGRLPPVPHASKPAAA